MGLDMYLFKKTYIGAQYDHHNVTGEINIKRGEKPVKIDLKKLNSITEDVGYWRKANAIHGWFVENVQDGVDDCREHYVPYEKLLELKELCEKELAGNSAGALEPTEGFFFGSTEKDEGYKSDLRETIEMISELDPEGDYYYQSSW